ncbi:hypothetical protein [Krasilnikovia sp. MM14-A1004]|uniref:hypothetical protein n=1 Tax=Krasilnikovia sp. MM14-A1004 TaxID=3373541 RepID=UPI00399CE75B
MSDVLEGRYGKLLRCYPAADRSRIGDELLDVLLASARPGQRWPDARQGAALVLAGLRTRALAGRLSARAMWTQGLQIAAVGLLTYSAVAGLFEVGTRRYYGTSTPGLLAGSATLTLLAIPFALRGRFLVAAAAMWTAYGLHEILDVGPATFADLHQPWVKHLLAALALTALATVARPARGRRSGWWLAPLVVLALIPRLPLLLPPGVYLPRFVEVAVLVGMAGVALGWMLIDPRVGAAAAWWSLGAVLIELGTVSQLALAGSLKSYQPATVIAALVAVAGFGVAARRRAARL